MRPEWFSTLPETTSSNDLDAGRMKVIPYEKMWADDAFWLPFLLLGSGNFFIGRADFGVHPSGDPSQAGAPMKKWWFASVNKEVKVQ